MAKPKDKHLEYLWLPVAITTIADCNPRTEYIVDCCLHKIASSITARLMLIKKMPRGVETTHIEPIEAPKLDRFGCDPVSFLNDLKELWEMVKTEIPPQKTWSDYFEPSRWVMSHFLSPTKWVLGNMEKMPSTIASSITRKIMEDMLKQLCVDKNKAPSKWSIAYILIGLDIKKEHVYLFLGKKKVRSSSHELYIFRNPDVRAYIRKYIPTF